MKRKPVVFATVETMWQYEYQAKGPDGTILASDSLLNLKQAIKDTFAWKYAWLTCADGVFAHGQVLVDEYHYRPRY